MLPEPLPSYGHASPNEKVRKGEKMDFMRRALSFISLTVLIFFTISACDYGGFPPEADKSTSLLVSCHL